MFAPGRWRLIEELPAMTNPSRKLLRTTSRKSITHLNTRIGPSRQQQRTEATRKALLDAAQRIFARDGFEAARLEDIAARTGRSRGAFYANYRDKEELFFALRERALHVYGADLTLRLQNESSPDSRLSVLQQFIAERFADKDLEILRLEFKLFAIRHPQDTKKLAEQHLRTSCRSNAECLNEFFPAEKKATSSMWQQRVLCIEAMVEGLVLNHAFIHEVLSQRYLDLLVAMTIEVLFKEPELVEVRVFLPETQNPESYLGDCTLSPMATSRHALAYELGTGIIDES
jgi:AcrR family transcriptional regulator